MPLPHDYSGQSCSLARTLEIVGERWTLLIVRDAFYGVRRFGDFAGHLSCPRAVLADRLRTLTAAGVLAREPGASGRDEYVLTDKGIALWPAVYSLIRWGDGYYADAGPRRLYLHSADEGPLDLAGRCGSCGQVPDVAQIVIVPGPGLATGPDAPDDAVTRALAEPHRLLEPLHTTQQPQPATGGAR